MLNNEKSAIKTIAASIDNKLEKIDPYKYLFAPSSTVSSVLPPPKYPSKPTLCMPSLKDVQPKFDEYIDLNSLQPKVNQFHTQEYLNSFQHMALCWDVTRKSQNIEL